MSATCSATKKNGDPCNGKPMKGRDVCKQHSGDANVGQRSKLTPDIRDRVADALRAGNYREIAARLGGIGVSTFYGWMERGEADIEAGHATPHAEFAEAVQSAEAESEAQALLLIRRAAAGYTDVDKTRVRGSWQAAAWYLERTRPQRYALTPHVRAEVNVNRPAEVPEGEDVAMHDADVLAEVTSILADVGVIDS